MKNKKYKVFYVISLMMLFWYEPYCLAQWGDRKKTPDFNRIPREQNKKSIIECLVKVKDIISDTETYNLDSLKTLIERVYGLNKSYIKYRELLYKTQTGERWRVEFYLIPDSLWGNEKYKVKFFKAEDKNGGAFGEVLSPPIKDSILDKASVLKYAQFEEVEVDERWESFFVPKDPTVKFKSKNFKLFELIVEQSLNHTTLNCSIVSGQSVCQCFSSR